MYWEQTGKIIRRHNNNYVNLVKHFEWKGKCVCKTRKSLDWILRKYLVNKGHKRLVACYRLSSWHLITKTHFYKQRTMQTRITLTEYFSILHPFKKLFCSCIMYGIIRYLSFFLYTKTIFIYMSVCIKKYHTNTILGTCLLSHYWNYTHFYSCGILSNVEVFQAWIQPTIVKLCFQIKE